MYCIYCGKEIFPDSKFCRYFGNNIEEIDNKLSESLLKKEEENKHINESFLLRSETDRQLFGIKVLLIISILFYLSFILYSISIFESEQDYFGLIYLFLTITVFSGFIYLSSLAFYSYNRKRFYALPILRATLALFSFWVGFIPTGLILILVFWRRLSLPVVKKFLISDIEDKSYIEIEEEKRVELIKTMPQKKRNPINKKILAISIAALVIISYFIPGIIYFSSGWKSRNQNQYLNAAYNYKIARIFLIPNSTYNMNNALSIEFNLIGDVIRNHDYDKALKKIQNLEYEFPHDERTIKIHQIFFDSLRNY